MTLTQTKSPTKTLNIILFAAPGVLGPLVFASLLKRKTEKICCLVLAVKSHSVSPQELILLAQSAQVPVLCPTNLGDLELIEKLKAAQPDLVLVASYDQKIPREIIDLPKLGAINLHPSLLPKYRGACPEFWTIRNGERKTGVTLHKLTNSFDRGDILLQEVIPIGELETLGALLYKISEVSIRMIEGFLDQLAQNHFPQPRPQEEVEASQAPLVVQQDLCIDWNLDAKEILNLIRAANPLAGAWTFFRGHHFKIWYATVETAQIAFSVDERSAPLLPGELIRLENDKKLVVQTGNGVLHLMTVQLSLYYIIDGWSFSESVNVQEGERLGE